MKQFPILAMFLLFYAAVAAQPAVVNKNAGSKTFAGSKQTVEGVSGVSVFVSPGYAAGCNDDIKHFEFTAVITADAPCTVKYQWERSDGGIDGTGPHTLVFSSAGTQVVTSAWDLGLKEGEGWKAVTVLSPNNIRSNNAAFKIGCCNNGDACAQHPFVLSSCTEALMNSYKNLAEGIGVRNCHPTKNYPSVSGTMSASCYGSTSSVATISFASYYTPGSDEWRSIWGSQPVNFTYYGVCPPAPIVYPLPPITENHVFAVKLIRQADYRSFTGATKNYTTLASVPGVRPADVAAITSVQIEEKGGYISATEAADYDNSLSSKGIVVTLKMRNGATETCYVINNYDKAGTLNWKQKNPACGVK